jgi:hypothetical protein
MLVVEESAEACTVRSAELEIRFCHMGDRWQHCVSIRRHGESLLLLTSDEGSPQDEALPSPALQDLRLERLAVDVAEFQLLGQAGKGIYSAAVRFDGPAESIDFDVCARRRGAGFQLCTTSRYTLAHHVETPVSSGGDMLLMESPSAKIAVRLSPIEIAGLPLTRCRLVRDESAARIVAGCVEADGADSAKEGATVRWRYRLQLADPPQFPL